MTLLKDLLEGDRTSIQALVGSVSNGTNKSGSPYLNVELRAECPEMGPAASTESGTRNRRNNFNLYMDSPGPIQVVTLIILIFLSGFFSSAETAFVSCNKARIRSLADEGNKKAARVLRILEKGSKLLSTVLIGNNIVNLTASAISTMLATDYFGISKK